MPAIKIEEASPEPLRTPKATTASFDTAVETWERSFERNMRGVKPLMPPPPTEPYAAATQTHLVPTLYCGSSPRKYRLTAPDSSTGRLNVLSPPFSMRLPPQSDPVIATRRVNKTTATTTTSYHASTPQPTQVSHLGHSSRDKSNTTTSTRDKMDENDFDYDEAFTEYNGFPSMLIQEEEDEMISIPRSELDDLRFSMQLLQNAHAQSEETSQRHNDLLLELIAYNQRTHAAVESLEAHMHRIDSAKTSNIHLRQHARASTLTNQSAFGHRSTTDARSRSPSPDYRGNTEKHARRKGRKDLEIKIPDKKYATAAPALPTPVTHPMGSFPRTPMTPSTPGRIGPPIGTKKTATCIHKRGIHNLNDMVPPIHAQIPALPLTDTEIIVYFFNSLCRPIVSLRLYARGWGPAAISDTINSYREIAPPYLRNTCSVKCTTAIKKGIERYGRDWEDSNRTVFQDHTMTDEEATDIIRLGPDESHLAVDFYLRDLCHGLRNHPSEDDAGVFTRCVIFCQENNAAYKLSDVQDLAADLEAERMLRRIETSQQELEEEDSSSSQL